MTTPDGIMQLGLGFWGSKALLSAIELGLFTSLAESPADADTLTVRLGLNGRGARDLFDALVALGMLERDGAIYRNTPATGMFLDRKKPSYVGGILEMANARLWPAWGHLTTALKTGTPQNEVGGASNTFEVLYSDPKRLKSFLEAMSGISIGAGMAIAQKFPWAKYKSVADVGTAQGAVLVQITRAHEHLAGVGVDLPVVRPIFEEYVAGNGLAGRVRFVPADMFKDPWPAADVYVLGHILHDWSLDEKLRLLKKAYDALPAGGAIVLHEAIIDDERRRNAFGLLMSLNMLIETPAGFDYTGADAQGWMRQVGFRETRVEPLVGPDSMVVGEK